MTATQQMIEHFQIRTKEHIDRVTRNMIALEGFQGLSQQELMQRALLHDKSKFESPEYEPYIWLTEYFRCKQSGIPFEYPGDMKEQVHNAIKHHHSHNAHHIVNKKTSELDLIEKVCDWTAMSQELNQNNGSCYKYYQENKDKFRLSQAQKEFIEIVIKELNKRLNVQEDQ
ncbi:Conserved_hypothetical protein [Hexamita inflata]|uniref:HD domain-containing protein n=1 Tax=Hexamita inflata TaxID=28002 RepID=A0AA86VS28_9EUKA|nr:Conserved hypothetical protein [Hexamita inflata]